MTTVLITTAIAPPADVPYLAMTDVSARTVATRCGVYYWAAQKVKNIVIADATGGTPMTEEDLHLLAKTGCTVEQISYRQDDASIVQRGKGHAEGKLIAFALEQSQLLQGTTRFYKSTGKTFCRNFWQVDQWLTAQNVVGAIWALTFRSIDYAQADLKFFCATPAFFRQIMLPGYAAADDTRGHIAESTVMSSAQHQLEWKLAPRPQITGFSGTSDSPYPEINLGDLEGRFPCLLQQA